MNDIDEEAADELTVRYRRASAGDPSRPNPRTRAAINAQARAAMTYRSPRAADEAALAQLEATPAANDSRWKLRAMAGLAGVGLAGLLTMHMYRSHPTPAVPPTTAVATVSAIREEPPAPVQARNQQEARDLAPLAASSKADGAREDAGAAGAAYRASDAVRAKPQADLLLPPPRQPPQQQKRGASDRQTLPVRRAVDKTMALDQTKVNAISARYFPAGGGANWQPGDPQAWVLLDSTGNVLRTGTHAFSEMDDLSSYLRSTYPGIRISQWATTKATPDARSQPAPISLLWLAADSHLTE